MRHIWKLTQQLKMVMAKGHTFEVGFKNWFQDGHQNYMYINFRVRIRVSTVHTVAGFPRGRLFYCLN